jgi:hypothetical protein
MIGIGSPAVNLMTLILVGGSGLLCLAAVAGAVVLIVMLTRRKP